MRRDPAASIRRKRRIRTVGGPSSSSFRVKKKSDASVFVQKYTLARYGGFNEEIYFTPTVHTVVKMDRLVF